MADTHWHVPGTAPGMIWWNRLLKDKLPQITGALAATVRELAPDFIVHCGDLTDDSAPASFQYARNIMDQMGCPGYAVLGNHDTFRADSRAAFAEHFETDNGICYYTRELGGLRFIFLDCAYWTRKDGGADENINWDEYKKGVYLGIGPTEEELKWLARELARDGNVPTVVVMHPPVFSNAFFPVGSLPCGRPVRRSPSPFSDFAEYCVGHAQLKPMLAAARNVKLVLAGHWHLCDHIREHGRHYCQSGALIEFPFELRLGKIAAGRLSLTTVGLKDRSLRELSLVPELRNEWVAGRNEDRTVEIELGGNHA
jgi:hypothetical protein